MLVEMWIGQILSFLFPRRNLSDVCLLDVVCGLGVVSVRLRLWGVAVFLRNAESFGVKDVLWLFFEHLQSLSGFLLGVGFGGGGRMWRGVGCISAPG